LNYKAFKINAKKTDYRKPSILKNALLPLHLQVESALYLIRDNFFLNGKCGLKSTFFIVLVT